MDGLDIVKLAQSIEFFAHCSFCAVWLTIFSWMNAWMSVRLSGGMPVGMSVSCHCLFVCPICVLLAYQYGLLTLCQNYSVSLFSVYLLSPLCFTVFHSVPNSRLVCSTLCQSWRSMRPSPTNHGIRGRLNSSSWV